MTVPVTGLTIDGGSGRLLAAVYVPGFADLVRVEKPGTEGWLLIMGASLLPWFVGLVVKAVDGMQITT